ncbi:hypothetical protein B6R96_07855 [Streptomyces sp. Sge12]|nr:hypothetical protein B6R96_07855 [Streptomyces sp. Sge12]
MLPGDRAERDHLRDRLAVDQAPARGGHGGADRLGVRGEGGRGGRGRGGLGGDGGRGGADLGHEHRSLRGPDPRPPAGFPPAGRPARHGRRAARSAVAQGADSAQEPSQAV